MMGIGRRQIKIGIMTKQQIQKVKNGVKMLRIGTRQLKIGIMTKKKMKVIGEPIAQIPWKAFFMVVLMTFMNGVTEPVEKPWKSLTSIVEMTKSMVAVKT